jgi:cyclopropane-fatty-acyl-phospholipid synthase
MADAAGRLAALVERATGSPLPLRVRAWDGSEAGPPPAPGAPLVVIRDRRALRRVLYKPGELGLARAWVAGEIDIEGDLYAALDALAGSIWERDDPAGGAGRDGVVGKALRGLSAARSLGDASVRAMLREAVALAGPGLPPPPPAEEVRRAAGPRHTLSRDRRAISHHYDVGNAFYERVLGPSMVYSCAYWQKPGGTLEDAQASKLDLICRKLGLREGMRLLDVGCGWGSMVLHAARHHGVTAVGVTLSTEQAAFARERIAREGLADRIEIRVQDYREVADGPFDAISSIGMAEHVGSAQYLAYAGTLYGLLVPGGRLLNHQIARRPMDDESGYEVDAFIDAYVFPDGELAPVGTTVSLLERAGFEARDVEALREHYALTLRAWVANLEDHWAEAIRLTTPGRARVWRLYMAASALAFEHNRIGVNQILAVRPERDGGSGLPATRAAWLAAPEGS